MAKKKTATKKTVETLRHADSRRTNIPTAEQQSVMEPEEKYSVRVAYERRNRDLDPQLVWRGKDEQDAEPLVANAPPLYIQEKVHPKVLIDDLMRRTDDLKDKGPAQQMDLFGDFNGLPEEARSAEFYQHDANWTNRMILGDSLQVMASLAEREGLRGKVQCIYFDPPYGIKFNSNFQWSTTSNSVTDGKADHITREPEQVKAFRDTWRDGIHSYLAYLRERLVAARDLLTESGSVFVQIGDENAHRVRALMDEVFGESNCVAAISYKTSVGLGGSQLDKVFDSLIWFAKNIESVKYRQLNRVLTRGDAGATRYSKAKLSDGRELNASELKPEESNGVRYFTDQGLTSRRRSTQAEKYAIHFEGKDYKPGSATWRTTATGLVRVKNADRMLSTSNSVRFKKFFDDFGAIALTNFWDDVGGGIQSRADPKIYVVQTNTSIVERCLLMTTDPGDLVLDPTCGSGTTAQTAEMWGRRWITMDTSRVALALARARITGAS